MPRSWESPPPTACMTERATRTPATCDRYVARERASSYYTTSVVCPLVGETTELTLHIPRVYLAKKGAEVVEAVHRGRPPLPQRPPAVVRVRVLHDGDSTSAPEFDESHNIPTVPTMRLRYGPIKHAGPFLLAIEVDGAHVMGSPFSLHCRPSFDAAAWYHDPMSRALLYIIKRELERGMSAWYLTYAALKAKRDSMRKSLGHMLNHGLSRGWGAWIEMAIERAEFLRKLRDLRQGLRRMTNRKLALGWNAWYSTWEEGARKRYVQQRGLGHTASHGLSREWRSWVKMASEHAEIIRKLRKGLSFMINRKMALGFAGWLSTIGHKQMREAQQGHMTKAALHLMNRELSRGWTTWYTTWEALKAKCETTRKSLIHMLNRGLSRGWGAWLEMAIERADVLRTLRKGLSWMTIRELVLSFREWRSAIAPRDDPMSKALGYLMSRKLALGWTTWHSTWEEGAYRRSVLHRGVGHIVSRGLSRGWSAWAALASERAEIIRKLHKGLSFLINRKMALGFVGWLSAIGHKQMREAQQGHMTRALLHLMNRELSRGWTTWYTTCEALKGNRETTRKSLGHMLNRGLSRGWGVWLEMAIERADIFRTLRKGLGRTTNHKLTFGFNQWVAACAPCDDAMSKALLYLMNRELSRGWTTWYTTWEALKAKCETTRKSLIHMLNRGLSRGWGVWVEMVVQRAEFARKLHMGLLSAWARGLCFMISRTLAIGFAGWLFAIAHRQMREAQQRLRMTKALLQMMNRELSRGWLAWYAMWAALKAKPVARRLDPDEEAALKAAMQQALAKAVAEAEEAAEAEAEEWRKLLSLEEDEEVVDLWDEPLPASPAPRKTASFAKRSAAKKVAAEEAFVSSMKAAVAMKKAGDKPPLPPPRRLTVGFAAAAPEKAAASSAASPTSPSSPDLGKEIGQAVSFVFVETPVALFKSSAELINRVDDELRLTHDARWDDPEGEERRNKHEIY